MLLFTMFILHLSVNIRQAYFFKITFGFFCVIFNTNGDECKVAWLIRWCDLLF